MLILFNQRNAHGGYSGIQESAFDSVPEGCLEFPPEKWKVFFPPDKECGGFVDLVVDGDRIIDVAWNEEAYQSWLASRPVPEPKPPAELEQLRVDVDFLAAMQGVSL